MLPHARRVVFELRALLERLGASQRGKPEQDAWADLARFHEREARMYRTMLREARQREEARSRSSGRTTPRGVEGE